MVPSATADPLGYYIPLGEAARVVYQGADQQVQELYLTGSQGWGHADPSALSGGTPPMVGRPFGYYTPLGTATRVVYRGADQHVAGLARQC